METQRIYIWICFFFCLALAAGGIYIFFQKKAVKAVPSSRYLQYFLILIYTFGFYSIWANLFLRIFFTSIAGNKTLSDLPQYLALIGVPFLIIGMIMLLLWATSILQNSLGRVTLASSVIVIVVIIAGYLAREKFDVLGHVHQVYALLILLVCTLSGMLLLTSNSKYLEKRSKNKLVLLIIFSGVIQIPLLMGLLTTIPAELIFIFFFFLTNTMTGIFYAYSVLDVASEVNAGAPLSLSDFIKEYGITSRESEIVQEIYNGKTNQEIADKLFVTVQTIKDHTSRIYLKTNLKNRAQLTSHLRRYQ
jgi:DNA-binding CsgD family transcriptional regulator